MNITYVHADGPHEWNSAEWRCAVPARALNQTGRHSAQLCSIWVFQSLSRESEYYCEDADVIVLLRGAMPDAWPAVQTWQRRGKTIIADIDDGYPQLDPSHPAYDFWLRGLGRDANGQVITLPRLPILDMEEGLRRVAGLTSPSRQILHDWSAKLSIRTGLIPNYVPLEWYRTARRMRAPADDGLYWIGWGGSAGHYESFAQSGIIEALARVMPRYPRARLVYCGSDPRPLEMLPVASGQKYHMHWTHISHWYSRQASFDLMLIPLAGEFDARRSLLKPIEASLLGVPWIASRSPAYDDVPRDVGIWVENTPESWIEQIEDLMRAGPDPHRLARAKEWAETYDIMCHTDEIVRTYEQFITH